MYVRMCISVSVCMHVCKHACMHVSMRACIYMHTYICAHNSETSWRRRSFSERSAPSTNSRASFLSSGSSGFRVCCRRRFSSSCARRSASSIRPLADTKLSRSTATLTYIYVYICD